ncbi:23S rRNA m(6)A-1618 methyltransferase [Pontibacter ummariensis]|uniref:Ribosomal RNA large subunit methyltransferase F n=1 Tax=Pontibacter ummariensis TaxID=1610492 RepID=A0A239CLG4_9BACT|nr:23S rRNA (adenine(1618)-N(6))-methyltransferase RlmF [Pontibacter ummariensis]PRY14975.1 23S rRNA m(6)A-1618 methyltransferase [Pontibacter ummariensis]SNS20344.1 23S rRNA m(6)A-1618 methyltransferase [Pontibacter ummariensis]
MAQKKKSHPEEKSNLHPRNRHRTRYDFSQLIKSCPGLEPFVKLNAYQDASVDFFDPKAVKMLNKALLVHFYGIKDWDIPPGFLCPPIPGRADYIHHTADLLAHTNRGKIPTGNKITCLDVGVGASCVYPIIGIQEYGWSFIAADIDPVSIASSNKIVEANPALKEKVELRLQKNPQNIFLGIIRKEERIDLTVCNPPFHASLAEAQAGTIRKLTNLKQQKVKKPTLNFGGQKGELWCEGGEKKFVTDMVDQSKQFATSCFWFTSLVSKQANLSSIYHALKQVSAFEVKTIPMGQGNKTSRLVAWTFLSQEQQKRWAETKWQ